MTTRRKSGKGKKTRQRKPENKAQAKRQPADPGMDRPGVAGLQQMVGNRAVQRVLRSDRPDVMMRPRAKTITFSPGEVDVITGDPHAKTWQKYISQYNGMIQTTIRNTRDAWQDGVNTFETEMQFPSAGEAQAKVGEALLTAAAGELFGFLVGEVAKTYPGVGTAVGAITSIAKAVHGEVERAKKAAHSMALGSFIAKMRTDMGNKLNDLAAQRVKREDALVEDFKKKHLGKDTEYERVQFFKKATDELGALKIHSQPITRSLAETWIAENFKQEANWLGHLVTTGVIELKYEVEKIHGMRAYIYGHCKVAMSEGGRVAKAINRTYGGKPIDLKSFKCRKRIILENRDNRYRSEEGILDENNNRIAGYLGAFGWYWGMPRGLVVSKFDE
jgi:hypothetical protein